jgi:hypothetical protein
MSKALEEMRQERHDLWVREWSEGVAYCCHCDKDYTKKETLVIDGDKYCPHCKQEEDKRYYYCEDHGQIACDECKHGGDYR